MKNVLFCIISIFFIQLTAHAEPEFEAVMTQKLNDYGLFNGSTGVVYADTKNFEGSDSLLIVNMSDSHITCEIYDNTDGLQLTDKIDFAKKYDCKLSCGVSNNLDILIMSSKDTTEYFTVQNDTIIKTDSIKPVNVEAIAGYSKGKPVSYIPKSKITALVTQLKNDTLSQYSFENALNTLPDSDLNNIRFTLAACADIMTFDIKNYDYDRLFKYILYTHTNFSILTDIPPFSGESSSLGFNNVSIVNSNFIDYIMNTIFRITPEKPPVNNLLQRGFCYNNGYYFYTGGFDVYFSTEIRDIIGVYNLGSGVKFVVFEDIYTEGNTKTPEYSFAILQKTDEGYSLLRLGMGEPLPSEHEIRKYSPFFQNISHFSATPIPKDETADVPVYIYMTLIIAVGIVGLVCGIYLIIKQKR